MELITKDKLRNIIGQEKFNILENSSIQKGSAFLNGENVSSFNNINNSLSKKISNSIQDIIIDLSSGIMKEVSAETGKMIGNLSTRSAQLAISIPIRIKENSIESFNENKKSFGEILNEVMNEQGAQSEEIQEILEQQSQENIIDKCNKSISNAIFLVGSTVNELSNNINSCMRYYDEGIDTLLYEINNCITNKIGSLHKQLNEQMNDIEKNVDLSCKEQGDRIGTKLAEQYNQELKKQAENQLAKIKKTKTKANMVAIKAKQSAALNVMSLTGVNIKI